MGRDIKEIIKEVETLPSLPIVVAKMAAMLNDDSSGAADFERVVRPDPALTTNLLKLANSPFFGARRQISTVRQAIAFLGTERLFELVTSAWFSKTLPRRIPGYDVTAKSLWLHSVAVGILNEQLARAAHIPTPDMAFTAGLLHDIGKVAAGAILAEQIDVVFVELNVADHDMLQAEREVLGINHAEVGGILCKEWQLPENLEWAARWHHDPNGAPPGVNQELVDLTHLADCLAHNLGFGSDIKEQTRQVAPEVLDRLILDVPTIDAAVSSDVTGQIWEMGELVSGGISC